MMFLIFLFFFGPLVAVKNIEGDGKASVEGFGYKPVPSNLTRDLRVLDSTMAKLSEYVKHPLYEIKSGDLGDTSFEIFEIFDNTHRIFDPHVHGMALLAIDHSNDQCAIAIRGTTTIWDWKNNLDIIPACVDITKSRESCDGPIVHKGFLLRQMNLLNNDKEVNEFDLRSSRRVLEQFYDKCRNYTMLVTGHSLGGAAAMIQYLSLQYGINGQPMWPKDKVQLVTFGQPRLFRPVNVHKHISYDSFCPNPSITNIRRVRRYVRTSHRSSKRSSKKTVDLVPTLPPSWSFCSGGFELNDHDRDNIYYHDRYEFPWTRDSFKGSVPPGTEFYLLPLPWKIKSLHSMDGYKDLMDIHEINTIHMRFQA